MEIDIPQFEAIQTSNIILLKRLLQVIATSVPFKPNMQAVSQRTGISLNTLKNYLQYLNNAKIITLRYASTKGLNSLGKPEKIYLQNPNLIYNLGESSQNTGNLRETFFMMNLNEKNKVESSQTSDFLIDNKYTFEIGGRNKGQKQIKDIPDSFIVKDDIVVGNDNIIPLWLFGFLY